MVAMPPRGAATLALLGALLVAGCAGDAGGPAPGTTQDGAAGGDAPADGPATVTGLRWNVGHSWTHRWTSESAGLDFTVRSIVVANESGAYVLATDDRLIAAQHAAFFFMDLGRMADGTVTSGAFSFPWYDFPLVDNKTWTATETNLGDSFDTVSREVAYTARLAADGSGRFLITGVADGQRVLEYDYDPEHGWFSEYQSYTVPPAGGEPVPAFRITAEGQDDGFTGTYYDSSGELVVAQQAILHPGSTAPPAGQQAFALDAAHTDVFGILFAFGAAGAGHSQLVAPDGQHWEATGAGDPDGGPLPLPVPGGVLLFTPAQPGQWQAAWGGGGLVAGGGAYVWGLTIAEGTL